ncbi:MAG: putative aminopeptidase [Acidobacteriales bacterium]|nr:putative aminopeptidase [Terriglobales bacterium]
MRSKDLLLLALATTALAAPNPAAKTSSKPDGKSWWAHVQVLADDKMEGRDTGSEGHRKAAAYVADQFKKAGLKPAGTKGYYQPVKFNSRKVDESASSLELIRDGKYEPLTLGEDANFSMRIDPAPDVTADLVFVGYGLTVPEQNYDDLAGLDLKGKIVVIFAGAPSSLPGPLASHYQSADQRWKTLQAAGVIGSIGIPNPKNMDIPWSRSTLARLKPAMSLADPALNETAGQKFAVTFNPAHADKLFAGTGHTLDEIVALHTAGKPLPKFALPVSVKAKVKVDHSELESQNVVGLWPGTDPKLKNEYVVLSAHIDHLGIGEPIAGTTDRIYNGAMDNASGAAMMMDVAAKLKEQNAKPKRSIVFVAVTGEEKGLLGSKYFAHHPTVKADEIVANVNTDMFLPLYPLKHLTVYGLDESDLGDDIRAVGKEMNIDVQTDPEPQRNSFIRSDQYSFIRTGVPALAMKDGFVKGTPEEETFHKWLAERYHAPSDDLQQPVDLEAAGTFEEVMLQLVKTVADRPSRPQWKPDSFFKRYAK